MLSLSTLDERESCNELGQQLIQSACWHGRAPALRLLASRFGCSLRCKWSHVAAPVDDSSTMPFSAAPLAALAAARNQSHCLRVLAELSPAGALCHSRDDKDRFAAHYAAAGDASDALRALSELGAGVTLSAVDTAGRTPAHVAAEMGRTAALEVLHELGADMSVQDRKGCTALHCAAMLGQVEAAVLLARLLPKQAVDAYDHDGLRAIHVAARDNRPAVITALVGAGADLAVQDRDGRSPAHWAAAQGHDEALRQLAAAGAPLALPDHAGYSPAYIAAGGQHKGCLAGLAKSAPRHLGSSAGFAASAVRPKAYTPEERPSFDPAIYARNLSRVKTRP